MADPIKNPPQSLQEDKPAAGAAPPQTLSEDNAAPVANPPATLQEDAPKLGIMDHVKKVAQSVIDMTPIGDLHDSAKAVQDWAAEKMSPANPHMLGTDPTFGPTENFAVGALRDTAGLVAGATSPAGVGTIAAGIAAPEVVGPVMVVHGIHGMIQGWDDSKSAKDNLLNPDTLQGELNSAAEVTGGAAGTGEAMKTRGGPVAQLARQKIAGRGAAAAPDAQLQAFKTAVPPTKTNPYTDTDVVRARPYLEAEHQIEPIDSPGALREASTRAVEKIETRVADAIKTDPSRLLKFNPLEFARNALREGVPRDTVALGLKELERYDLGFQRGADEIPEKPLTLQRADDIRAQLNAANKSVLDKSGSDINTARQTDPAFMAREAAAEGLRIGIYGELKEMGFPDMDVLRRDEGALLKIRNAASRQDPTGAKPAPGAKKPGGVVRKAAAGTVRHGAKAAGAAIGAHAGTGGAIAGYEVGGMVGEPAASAIEGVKPTRASVLSQAFSPVPVPQPVQMGGAGAVGAVAGNAQQEIHFRASDGSLHAIPANENALAHAKQIDPGLQVVPEQQ